MNENTLGLCSLDCSNSSLIGACQNMTIISYDGVDDVKIECVAGSQSTCSLSCEDTVVECGGDWNDSISDSCQLTLIENGENSYYECIGTGNCFIPSMSPTTAPTIMPTGM